VSALYQPQHNTGRARPTPGGPAPQLYIPLVCIAITVVRITPGAVRIGVEAPDDVPLVREEIAGKDGGRSEMEQSP